MPKFELADQTPATRNTGPNPLTEHFQALAEAGEGKALVTVEPYKTEAEQKAVRALFGLARKAGDALTPPRTVRIRTHVDDKAKTVRVEFSLRKKIVHKREEKREGQTDGS